jgi:hypothetical protein
MKTLQILIKTAIYVLSLLFFFGCTTEFNRLSTPKDNGWYDLVELGHVYCVVTPNPEGGYNTPYCLRENELKGIDIVH